MKDCYICNSQCANFHKGLLKHDRGLKNCYEGLLKRCRGVYKLFGRTAIYTIAGIQTARKDCYLKRNRGLHKPPWRAVYMCYRNEN